MTTAHRPTFDPARGKSNTSTPTRVYSSRSLPAHKVLKYRTNYAQQCARDDEADLARMKLELYHNEGQNSQQKPEVQVTQGLLKAEDDSLASGQREIKGSEHRNTDHSIANVNIDDKDDSEYESESSDESIDDETELLWELEKIKKERAAERFAEEKAAQQEALAMREAGIAFGNPLLNSGHPEDSFLIKRRWDEDVVFRVKDKDNKSSDFVNDLLRSDFHRSFMRKYIR